MTASVAAGPADRVPAVVLDVEMTEPLPTITPRDPGGRPVDKAWLLIRAGTEPLGRLILDIPDGGLLPADLETAIAAEFDAALRSRIGPGRAAPPFLARRAEVLRTAPPITVVVCTRDRPRQLARCLDSLRAQRYPRVRVLVVDNAPTTAATARVARAAGADYAVEHRPGLSHARNTAVERVPGEILAWLDDDEIADRYWLSEVARAFADHPEADVVSGPVIPAELATPAQVWFEQFGGHSKGRGFTPAVFSPLTAVQQSPFYPLPPFATGANMTFRPGVIERIGGFDPALGAGTPAMGGEDTRAFTEVLRRGGTIVYHPGALVRHAHRRDVEGLRRQLHGYGVGLTAYYTSLIVADPRVLPALLALLPTAARDLLGRNSRRTAGLGADFPSGLLRANRRGMVLGPLAYLRGRLRARGKTHHR